MILVETETCPDCGLPTEPAIWADSVSGIGDDLLNIQVFQDDDELCSCGDADSE